MDERLLGKTGLRVSAVGLGTWSMGGDSYGPTDDADSLKALRRAYDLGVTFYDTADIYGRGRSERLLGEAFRRERDRVVIATKVGWDFTGSEAKKNFSPPYLFYACEQSLKRLQTDHLDLYQLHNPAPDVLQRGEVAEVMERLKAAGKIRHWGVSLSWTATPADARCAMEQCGAETIQLVYNILCQEFLQTIAPTIEATRVGVIARTPLYYGLLTGKFTPETTFPPGDHRADKWSRQEFLRRLRQVERLRVLVGGAGGHVKSLAEAAIRFVLSHRLVSVVIPGAKTAAQVEEHVAAAPGIGAPALAPEDLVQLMGIEFLYCPQCGAELALKTVEPGEPQRLVCPSCAFIFYLNPKVVASTITEHDGRVILLKRAIEPGYGRWVFPGGFVNRGEAVEAAAVRETKEEIGLDVRLTGLLNVYSYAGQQTAIIVYTAEVLEGTARGGGEALELKAFGLDEIPWRDLAFTSTRDALRDYVKRRGAPAAAGLRAPGLLRL